MKQTIVVLRGIKQLFLIRINGENINKIMSPFVGYEKLGDENRLCIGFCDEKTVLASYSGSALPLENFIQAFRAMKILEKLKGIDVEFLRDVYATASRDKIHVEQSIEFVQPLYQGNLDFLQVIKEIQATKPSVPDFNFALKTFMKNDVKINIKEAESDAEISNKPKRIFEDFEFDDKMHKLHEAAIILETYENNDSDYPKDTYEALKDKVGEDNALLFIICFLRRKFKYSNVYNDKDIEMGVNKSLRRYEII